MVLTVSSDLCTTQDLFKKPSHFSNRLTVPITISYDDAKGGPNYNIQLEGIAIYPPIFPNGAKPILVTCNLCDVQPCGKSFTNMLSMVYGNEKFTRPKVPARLGKTEEIIIEIKTINNNDVNNLTSVSVQLSLVPAENY